MTKYILAVAAACLFVVSPAFAAPPHKHPSHPGHSHPGHKPAHPGHNHHVHPGHNHHHCHPNHKHCYHGFAYRGITYRHYCYTSVWVGYTNRCWYPRYNCYVYWCPIQVCWFRYDGAVFIPLDDCCNPAGPR